MFVSRWALAGAAVAWACAAGAAQGADFAGVAASADARYVAQCVVESRDNKGAPFVIVDKIDARVFVFGPHGRPVDTAPALAGMARGDDSVPGVGDVAPEQIARRGLRDARNPAGARAVRRQPVGAARPCAAEAPTRRPM